MKIASLAAYQVDLPLREGSYKWSGGKSVEVFDSTIVRIETAEGIVGHGEVCPWAHSICPHTPRARGPASPSLPPMSWEWIPRTWTRSTDRWMRL